MSAIDRIRETDNNYDLTLEGEAILELSDSIQALTERVDRIEAVITHHLKYHVLRNKED